MCHVSSGDSHQPGDFSVVAHDASAEEIVKAVRQGEEPGEARRAERAPPSPADPRGASCGRPGRHREDQLTAETRPRISRTEELHLPGGDWGCQELPRIGNGRRHVQEGLLIQRVPGARGAARYALGLSLFSESPAGA